MSLTIRERYWVLLAKKLAQEANEEELIELEEISRQHPEFGFAATAVEELWLSRQIPGFVDHIEDAWKMQISRIREEKPLRLARFSFFKPALKFTAIILLIASLAIAIFLMISPVSANQKGISQVSTNPGMKSKVILPDGTIVWLNAGSNLSYGPEFGEKDRKVVLEGEAYFDVMKDKERPFFINTATIELKVLGTSFNVKAYPDDKTTETTLVEGSVEVHIKNRPEDKIILAPKEKLVVENTISTLANIDIKVPAVSINKLEPDKKDSSFIETKWRDNQLVFRNEPFDNILNMMSRWYGIEIKLEEPSLAEMRMSGHFERESISDALTALQIIQPFTFKKDGNIIYIKP